jgi:molybdopterin converting factor small subunit
METNTTVRMFGALHTHRREQGLEPTTEVCVPPQGCTGRDLACQLELPLEKIEAVFVNHVVRDIDHQIQAGDRVAFVPVGVPGPHRLLLGIFDAGRQGSKP